MAHWYYMKQRPGDTTREPIQGEFFATEVISSTAEAVVREGTQNTLDAGQGEVVRVRIALSGATGAAPADRMAPYLEGAWPHLQASSNGLADVPQPGSCCPYLVFEDFGTTGLEGDVAQWHKVEGSRNGFFTFFRAEGQSDKEKGERGRWGVGKFVFPRSSRISTFWGLTVRSSDAQRELMGRTILKSHAVEDERYVPDGYYGKPIEMEGGARLIVPFDEPDVIDRFCEDFGLQRGSAPGLSIVVPFYDTDEITPDSIVRAVIQGYFYPILSGDLVVTVASPYGETRLDSEFLVQVLGALGGDIAANMLPLVDLASWGLSLDPANIPRLEQLPVTGPPRWRPELIEQTLLAELRARFQANERLVVRVPFPVRRDRGRDLRWSHFDIFFVRDGTEDRGRPVFVREGIIISDVRGPYCRGIRALVVVEDDPLATLLGDSENPAHTQWQKDSSNYKGKYSYGPENLSFVINSVSEVVRFILEMDREADRSLLVDLFSLPASPDDPGGVRVRSGNDEAAAGGKKRKSKKAGGAVQPPPRQPRRFRVEKIAGGFMVSHGDPEAVPPEVLDIRVAYDIRNGNPLKKYNKADFRLDRLPIQLAEDKTGIELLESTQNRLTLRVTDPEFRLSLTGFDSNRDLFVRVVPREEETDGDETA